MFRDKHREDLKEAHENVVKAMRDTIIMQADMIDYLRSKADGHAYIPARTPALNPAQQPVADPEPGSRKWLSEEEEEIMALQLNGRISEMELSALQETLGLTQGLQLAPALPDE